MSVPTASRLRVVVGRPIDQRRTSYSTNPGATSLLSFEGMSPTPIGRGLAVADALITAGKSVEAVIATEVDSALREATVERFPAACHVAAELPAPRVIVMDTPTSAPQRYTKQLAEPTSGEQQELTEAITQAVASAPGTVTVMDISCMSPAARGWRNELIKTIAAPVVLLAGSDEPLASMAGTNADRLTVTVQLPALPQEAEVVAQAAAAASTQQWFMIGCNDGHWVLCTGEERGWRGYAGVGRQRVADTEPLLCAGVAAALASGVTDALQVFARGLASIGRRQVVEDDPAGIGYRIIEGLH
ncbi:hypothetical protein ACFPVT_06670 [Corynebacterium choanae]|uniref:Uncharacterized protein n=1 Tax=Corynebacterium choanae TaxID=1862358 RepID=A0A3G6JC75_9CORY|nr:hypothetical protein [Corynebacterium choanae]AZA13764.1 hypothetical protein CCHOA_06860 [Corynebacterium choanae]